MAFPYFQYMKTIPISIVRTLYDSGGDPSQVWGTLQSFDSAKYTYNIIVFSSD